MKDKQWQGALTIIKTLENAGYQAYLVGGCVRDFLLKREIQDIDIATDATPEQLKPLFKKVIPIGIAHGTVIVRKQQISYEITTFRKKVNLNNGTFSFSKKLAEDLTYRDFTINALAMDRNKTIIDLFNGQDDLNKKVIRAVEDPKSRLSEDPLRMLRAIRFASQLGFTIELNTLQMIAELKSNIHNVAIERIKDEMTALLRGKHVIKAIEYLIKTNLIYELPIFKENHHLISILMNEHKPFTSFAHVIVLLHYYERDITIQHWIKTWKCSNKEKKEAYTLLTSIQQYEQHGINFWLVYQLDESLEKPFIQLIDTICEETISKKDLQLKRNELTIRSRKELNVNGNLLMKWFPTRKRGPWIKNMLDAIEFEIVMQRLENEEQKIKEWILCHPLAID